MATNNAINVQLPFPIANGGTADTSLTAYAVVCGGTTTTGALQSIAGVGTSGQLLTSNGAAALPTFQNSSAGGVTIAVGAISGNWYASGSLFGSIGVTGTPVSTATGTLYFVPFYVSKATTYTQIAILSGATAAGTSVMGLYSDTGNAKPTGNPIANSNSTSVSNTTNTLVTYTFGTPVPLAVGTYWCAYSTSGTTTFNGCPIGYNVGGIGLGINATPTTTNIAAPQCGWHQAFTYSATLPTVGALTSNNARAVGNAYIYLQAQ